jgi:hypothetical protein
MAGVAMMDGREGGYIKAHRQWESSAAVLALSAEGEVVWLRLLFAANWKDSTVVLRTGPATVHRGQALIAERTLAERARVGRKVVRTALEKLTLAGAITISKVTSLAGPSVNLITVLNYDKYQATDESEAQGEAQGRPKVGPRSAQSEEGEEGKKGRSKTLSLKLEAEAGSVEPLRQRLLAVVRERGPYVEKVAAERAQLKAALKSPGVTEEAIESAFRAVYARNFFLRIEQVAFALTKAHEQGRRTNGHGREDTEMLAALASAERGEYPKHQLGPGDSEPGAGDDGDGDGFRESPPLRAPGDDVAEDAEPLSAALRAAVVHRRRAGSAQDAAHVEPGSRPGRA